MTYLSYTEIMNVLDKARREYIAKLKVADAKSHEKRFAFHGKLIVDKVEKDFFEEMSRKVK